MTLQHEQRVIKFRAFNKSEGRMVFKALFDRNWYYTPRNDENGCHTAYAAGTSLNPSHSDVMQFTGLKDRAGKEIYEGDVCRYGSKVLPVIWREDWGGFALKDGQFYNYVGGDGDPRAIQPEVIGNIHENPELLK